jgi:hypothetical protein
MQSIDKCEEEQKPYEPSKKELAEMDSLRSQAEQEIRDRSRRV